MTSEEETNFAPQRTLRMLSLHLPPGSQEALQGCVRIELAFGSESVRPSPKLIRVIHGKLQHELAPLLHHLIDPRLNLCLLCWRQSRRLRLQSDGQMRQVVDFLMQLGVCWSYGLAEIAGLLQAREIRIDLR